MKGSLSRRKKHSGILFFSKDANRSDWVGGKRLDRVIDPLAVWFTDQGFAVTTMAYPGSKYFGRRTFGHVVGLSTRFAFAALVAVVKQKSLRVLQVLTGSEGVGSISARTLGPGVSFYGNLLATYSPKLVIALNAPAGLCEAGKKKNIPVLELLHARGYLAPYSGWPQRDRGSLPDGVISTDDLSTKGFESLLPTLQIPNYRVTWNRVEPSYRSAHELRVISRFDDQIRASGRKVLVYTVPYGLSPELFGHHSDNWIPPELLELAERSDDYLLLVRIHPVLLHAPQRRFRKSRRALIRELRTRRNCEWQISSSLPIYEVFSRSHIHITFNSFSVYEAADLGISSLVLDKDWGPESERLGDLREEGYLFKVQEGESLEYAICKMPEYLKPRARAEGIPSARQILDFAEQLRANAPS